MREGTSRVTDTRAWLHLRSSLARPPGQAASDEERRQGTYVACILQFEQLVHAAETISPHARPLPLYYAAMQSARALVASFGTTPRSRGHGLSQKTKKIPDDVMQFQLKVVGKSSLFHELCVLTGSELPSAPLSLGELFLSLPDLSSMPNNLLGPRAMYAEHVPDPTEFDTLSDPFVRIRLETETLPAADRLLTIYPTLAGWHEEDPAQRSVTTRRQSALLFRSNEPIQYRDRHVALEKVAPTYRHSDERWVRTAIGGLNAPLSPLASWYALLHGFSILARYEPDAWVEALHPQREHAAAIDAALDEALQSLPELLWKEISILEFHATRKSGRGEP